MRLAALNCGAPHNFQARYTATTCSVSAKQTQLAHQTFLRTDFGQFDKEERVGREVPPNV